LRFAKSVPCYTAQTFKTESETQQNIKSGTTNDPDITMRIFISG